MFTMYTFYVDRAYILVYTVYIMEYTNIKRQPLFWNGISMVVLTITMIPLLLLDTRTLLGVNLWIKPIKFTLSLGIYSFSTLWILERFLADWKYNRITQIALTITSAIEIILITAQAARGENSHFNVSNPWNQIVFSVMGTSISIFWLFHLGMILPIFKQKQIPKAVKESLLWGLFIAGFGMIIGFFMTTPRPEQLELMKQGIFQTSGSHNFGKGEVGQGLYFFGWSTVIGDMRVPHFFGMHVMQVFFVLAAFLMPLAEKKEHGMIIRLIGVFLLLMNGLMVVQTLMGYSIFSFHRFFTGSCGLIVLVLTTLFIRLFSSPKFSITKVTT
ncbi:hypothetical protein [Leptospira levettii]|nr:hypothetical protein [Leptospira levettii]